LFIELKSKGYAVEQKIPIPVYYKNLKVGAYIADLLVNDTIIIELKAVENLHLVHEAQLVNYLTATGLDVGLLINFGSTVEVR